MLLTITKKKEASVYFCFGLNSIEFGSKKSRKSMKVTSKILFFFFCFFSNIWNWVFEFLLSPNLKSPPSINKYLQRAKSAKYKLKDLLGNCIIWYTIINQSKYPLIVRLSELLRDSKNQFSYLISITQLKFYQN